jgi:uncharacterized protein (DUF488 family)
MPTVYTIGTTKKTLEKFIGLLQEVDVDSVVDIRLRNTSQLAGYSKRDDLAFLLRQCFGIEYEHRPDLAPTAEIMDAFKQNKNFEAYEKAFRAVLAERDATAIGRDLLSRLHRPCLLCAEPTPDHCHRRLVAEWWVAHLPDVEVVHLT